MSDEWGPWIKHDGRGCPCVGMWAQVEAENGETAEGIVRQTAAVPLPGRASRWIWADIPLYAYSRRVIRYRIRRPKALRKMIDRAESLPLVAPKRVEPAGPLEVA